MIEDRGTEFGVKLIPPTEMKMSMGPEFRFAAVILFCAGLSVAQSAPQTSPVSSQSAKTPAAATPSTVTVYYAGPNVIAPQVIPVILTNAPTGHCKRLDGEAVLSAVVDASGIPHNVFFIKPIGSDLDKIALNLLETDRFKPGSHDGAPALVVITDKVNLNGCIVEEKNEAGQKTQMLRLRSVPDQQVDLQQPPSNEAALPHSAVTAPVILKTAEAEYSDYAAKQRISGNCSVSLIVDAHGMPQNPHITKSLEPSLDQNAIIAVSHYRFKPAMKNGTTPIAVMVTITVSFRL